MLTMKQWKKAIFALCLLGTTFVVCSCNTNSPPFSTNNDKGYGGEGSGEGGSGHGGMGGVGGGAR